MALHRNRVWISLVGFPAGGEPWLILARSFQLLNTPFELVITRLE
jgi:hypothetical protein